MRLPAYLKTHTTIDRLKVNTNQTKTTRIITKAVQKHLSLSKDVREPWPIEDRKQDIATQGQRSF